MPQILLSLRHQAEVVHDGRNGAGRVTNTAIKIKYKQDTQSEAAHIIAT